MVRLTIILILLVALIGCASEQYNKHVQSIFAYELDPELNRFSEKHIACYVCETGIIPTSVSQLTAYKATTAACAPLFNEKEIAFFYPETKDHLITMQPMEGRDVYVITRNGLTFSELESISDNQPYTTMALWHNKHECLPNK